MLWLFTTFKKHIFSVTMSGRAGSSDTLLWPTVETAHFTANEKCTFPTGMAFATGLAKLVLGLLAVVFAGMALLVDARLASVGGGLWAGTIAATSGVIALTAGRPPRTLRPKPAPPVGFIALTVLSLAASGLLVVLSGTGLGYDGMDETLDSANRGPAIAANAVLLVLATLDCLASIVALATSVRAACVCCCADDWTSDNKTSRLLQWLGGQRLLLYSYKDSKPFKPLPHPAVYTLGPLPPPMHVRNPVLSYGKPIRPHKHHVHMNPNPGKARCPPFRPQFNHVRMVS